MQNRGICVDPCQPSNSQALDPSSERPRENFYSPVSIDSIRIA